MTKITFYRKNKKLIGYEVSGHTGKGLLGEDILCSAISTVAQSGVVGINEVLKLSAGVSIKDGYLSLKLNPKDYDNNDAQLILKTIKKSFEGVMDGERKYVNMEVKDEI